MIAPFSCTRCGAALALPAELDKLEAVCAYCGQVSLLPPHIVIERRRQAEAWELERRQQIEAENARRQQALVAEQTRRQQRTGLWVTFGVAIFAFSIAAIGVVREVVGTRSSTPSSDGSATVAAALDRLRANKCTYVVHAPETLSGTDELKLTMTQGGACVHVVAAGAAGIDIHMSLLTPDAHTINAVQSSGVFELRHCPTTSGEHVAHVSAPAGKSFTVAAIDCPPEREVYKDDPKKNGRDLVTASMKKLEKSGCRDVVMAPATLHGKQSFKLKMQRGGYCINVLAASGVPGNAIELLLESPVGDAAQHSARAAEVTLEHCATTSGEHSLSVVPALDHYFTVAAMDCPRGHARK